jgi:hypothetical protein
MPKDVADWTTAVGVPWNAVGTYPNLGGGADTFITSPVPPETQSLGIAVVGSGITLTEVSVVGMQTGVYYLPVQSGDLTSGWFTIPINGAADSTYGIHWTEASGGGRPVMFFSSALTMGFPAIGPQPRVASVPVVITADQAAGKSGQWTSIYSLPVVIAADQSPVPVTFGAAGAGPPPWLFPNKPPLVVDTGAINSGIAVNLVAAVGGQSIYLFSVHVAAVTAPLGNWVDIREVASTVRARLANATAVDQLDLHGAACAAGAGLELLNSTGVNNRFEVTLAYSQA